MTKTIGDGDPRDFDETRRLLYMALVAPRTKKYNLVGTVVNALKHHHATDDLDDDQIADHIINVVEPDKTDPADYSNSRRWIREQVARISRELGD